MDINKLFSDKRTGTQYKSHNKKSDPRSEYQRDFDRVIFSTSFRRLQNKTQVFPLPGSVFVHNRLTHSLEVASVGRSLGSEIGNYIAETFASELTEENKELFKHSLYNVISTACLCHDIGNPAFGHSGEDAIASYFSRNEGILKDKFTQKQWLDFLNFEGNANAIRVLTQQQNGKSEGGTMLTFSTLASIAKYPCESIAKNKKILQQKKFGFFQSEKEVFEAIAKETSMIKVSDDPKVYLRHPFVWLVEAADDICYNIIDLEDSQRLGFINAQVCEELLQQIITEMQGNAKWERVSKKLNNITDKNDRISFLRAVSIGVLINRTVELYKQNFEKILSGDLEISIFDQIKGESKAIQIIEDFSIEHIYNHRSVVEIENAGYNVMYELLDHFIPSIMKSENERREYEKKAVKLIPRQSIYEEGTEYERVLGVLDFVSGMTDNYATDLYRKIKGIDIGMTL
ncbi:deoxyguanosinetriphosphate triphosphohydrolase [Apibacter adventoris]|uniref:Deoxyguanosinetriphosphate triphosphohydrolase n=1 Tax=Apibacter adventoris TaxID=1679466 RepID=A0A2S8A9A5_9FLAO|nr:deoxyguanosinetriphosphate triphosphohydrolase [Apibacter adventoris]PQL91164.1 deoxyguanosinetriphosphate triphosphohydrolase [Apibacter adventoris]PQL94063.1 deoxyguanosinetriphosphate triphosphohydrolase [Apibacter adventoris]